MTKKRADYLLTPSSSQSSASLMRQILPVPLDMKMEDFSFELNGIDVPQPRRPVTPSRSRPTTPSFDSKTGSIRQPKIGPRDPLPGRLFDLYFDDAQERSFVVLGALVPMSPLTLVSPAVPVSLPFIRLSDANSKRSSCLITCPSAKYTDGTSTSTQQLRNSSDPTFGTFTWMDTRGRSISPRKSEGIRGDVRVRVQRNNWGVQTMSILLPWPKRATEVAFTVSGDRTLRIQRAMTGGAALPRSLTQLVLDVEVRLGSNGKEGLAEVVLEMGDGGDKVGLPQFVDATGTMTIELRGEGWEGASSPCGRKCIIDDPLSEVRGNLKPSDHSPLTFTYDLSTSTPPELSVRQSNPQAGRKTRMRTLFSFSTFLNLFMLWLLISMGQQVQRLRNEVAFVADEARDLRLYGLGNATTPSDTTESPIIRHDEDGMTTITSLAETEQKMSLALGRVVFGSSAWDMWMRHPT